MFSSLLLHVFSTWLRSLCHCCGSRGHRVIPRTTAHCPPSFLSLPGHISPCLPVSSPCHVHPEILFLVLWPGPSPPPTCPHGSTSWSLCTTLKSAVSLWRPGAGGQSHFLHLGPAPPRRSQASGSTGSVGAKLSKCSGHLQSAQPPTLGEPGPGRDQEGSTSLNPGAPLVIQLPLAPGEAAEEGPKRLGRGTHVGDLGRAPSSLALQPRRISMHMSHPLYVLHQTQTLSRVGGENLVPS